MKHTKFFNDFINNEVNLNETRLDRLNTGVSAIQEYLSKNLESFEKSERQGSYALRTIIRPVKDGQEYDADILVYMQNEAGKEPKDYLQELHDCFQDNDVYAEKARKKTRCVTLEYAGDFHLDVVPCVVKEDQNSYVCNRNTNKFEKTDGTGYRDWFNCKNTITHGNLKLVTRLLKYLRDHKENFTAKSILLTTLIGNTVSDSESGDDFRELPEALKTVSNRINDFLQSKPTMPTIRNPALPEEDFNRHWDQKKYANFRRLFNTYTRKINDAYEAEEHDDSVDKWRDIFGDKFGKKQGGGEGHLGASTSVASVAVTPKKPYAR